SLRFSYPRWVATLPPGIQSWEGEEPGEFLPPPVSGPMGSSPVGSPRLGVGMGSAGACVPGAAPAEVDGPGEGAAGVGGGVRDGPGPGRRWDSVGEGFGVLGRDGAGRSRDKAGRSGTTRCPSRKYAYQALTVRR